MISDDFQIGPNGAYEHVGNELDLQYQDLLQHIQVVKKDLLNKFPNVSHTIRILMWDDDTMCVECSYTTDNEKKYISRIHNGILSNDEIDITGKVMILNKFGEEEYYNLVKI